MFLDQQDDLKRMNQARDMAMTERLSKSDFELTSSVRNWGSHRNRGAGLAYCLTHVSKEAE